MDEVFENIHSWNSTDLEDFFRLKMDMETREKYNEKKKENEKDVMKRYNKQYM